jgi:hypothetical protein
MFIINKTINNNIKSKKEIVNIKEKIFTQLINLFAKISKIILLIIFVLYFKITILLSLIIVRKIFDFLKQSR